MLASIAAIIAAIASLIAAVRGGQNHRNTKTSNGLKLGQLVEKHVKDDAAHFAAIEERLGMSPQVAENKKQEIETLKEGEGE